ncbi:hypothetical protein ACOMHN_003500 [Nucella lapillus]
MEKMREDEMSDGLESNSDEDQFPGSFPCGGAASSNLTTTADSAPEEMTAVNTAAGRFAGEDRLQPVAEADYAAKKACGQHEVPEEGPASPTGSEGASSL